MVGREKDMEVIRAGERDQASLRDQVEKLRRDLYSSSQQVSVPLTPFNVQESSRSC